MAIHVQIDPLERTATLRGVHSLCAGESSEVVLSGVPDADTPTLSLRVYRDATEAVQVACAVRPGTDPAEEGLVPVEGRAALRRGTLDLRSSAVSEWAAEDAAASAAADEARRSGSKEPEARAAASYRRPDSAWLVVADTSRVWAACEVPFVLRPFDDALSPDPEVPLPSYAERAEAAAGAAEAAAERSERAAEDAESAEATGKVGRDELFDDPDSASPKVKASLLPSYVDDVLEVSELPSSGESGKLYVVTGTNAVYRWTGSSFVEVSPSRDWSGELAAKRGLTDFSVGDGWLLVKPDGTQAWLGKPDPQQDEWTGDGFILAYDGAEGNWGLSKADDVGFVVDDTIASSPDANRLEFLGSDDTSVYRLVRGSRLALDTEIPPAQVVGDAVTRTGANPVKSSGIWSAIWGALTALPAGVASLYDWCVERLAGKRGLDDLAVYESGWVLSVPGGGTVGLVKPSPSANQWESGESVGDYAILHYPGTAQWTLFTLVQGSQTPQEVASVLVEDGDPDDVEFLDFGSGYSARFADAAAPTSDTLARQSALTAHVNDSTAHVTAADKAAWNAKQDALSATQLANIAAVPGKAAAADLRYRIAEAGYATTGAKLPEGASIWYNGVDVTEDGTLSHSETGTWVFGIDEGLVAWDEEGSFDGKAYEESVVLKVNGSTVNSFNLLVPRALADRTVNLITVQSGEAASIDIELPAAVTVDGVRYCRDFILDVDNYANADDLALEFTGLDVYYAFVPLEDDSISEMMTIGAGERVRLYFTETPYHANGSLPVINVARVTLGDFVTSTTPATQGGN